MDIASLRSKALSGIKKYRYALIILVFGLLLMLLPGKGQSKQTQTQSQQQVTIQQKQSMAEELVQILGQMQGVGKVKVMLTVSAGEKTIYQSDEDLTTNENGSVIRKETVIISGTDREQQALVSQVLPPEYLGAIIVCQGAEQASVRLAVVDAVSKATGLSSDKISVVKMK